MKKVVGDYVEEVFKISWNDIYKNKVVTADEAVKKIKSGDRVVVGHACGEPKDIIDAMVENKDYMRDVEIVHMVSMGKSEYAKPEMETHFHHNSIFAGATTREAVF